VDYRAKAHEAIDGAYEDAVKRLFDAELAHLTAKQGPPDTALTMQKIIGIHHKMTEIIAGIVLLG
jgi:hypothetical protein